MSVYVGIDVHRKRSQVAVVTEDGVVQVNRNVPNGVEPILGLIGDLPTGTAVAFEAAYGWGWLVELLEDYGFAPHLVHPLRCKAIASARLKNDKVDAATLAQLLRADLLPEAWIAPLQVRQLRALLRHRVALVRLRTGLRNQIHAVTADHGYDRARRRVGRRLLDRPRTTLARRAAPAGGVPADHHRQPRRHRRHRAHDRPPGPRGARAGEGRPAGQGVDRAARGGRVHRDGAAGRDRRHQQILQRPPAGLLGRADPDGARVRPGCAPRAHLESRARRTSGGCLCRRRRSPSGSPSSPPPTSGSRTGAAGRSPPLRWHASC